MDWEINRDGYTREILQTEGEAYTEIPMRGKHQSGKRLISDRKNMLR